jgi:hypothetical protein
MNNVNNPYRDNIKKSRVSGNAVVPGAMYVYSDAICPGNILSDLFVSFVVKVRIAVT